LTVFEVVCQVEPPLLLLYNLLRGSLVEPIFLLHLGIEVYESIVPGKLVDREGDDHVRKQGLEFQRLLVCVVKWVRLKRRYIKTAIAAEK